MPLSTAEEDYIADTIRRLGPRAAFDQLIAENDALIRGPELGNGRRIANYRTAIYRAVVRDWAEEQVRIFGYNRPFAVAALGGTGREEMAPRSDTDFALLFEDPLDDNPFLFELQRQILHTDEFETRCGFPGPSLPFSLQDVPGLVEKQLNSFLDQRPVLDLSGLTDRFRERIRGTFNPFEHFLHVQGFWKAHWENAAAQSEQLHQFDIKNDGLRVFLAGIWALAGREFVHSDEIYATLQDPRDLAAYDFLLRIRAFIHLRRLHSGHKALALGNHPEDVLNFDDFNSFSELLGPEANERSRFEFNAHVRALLLSARRRVAQLAKGIIGHELSRGREIGSGSPIALGPGGLFHAALPSGRTPAEQSRAALSLLLAAQRFGVSIDPAELQSTFANAGDWLTPGPELADLFYEPRGSLAATFEFLSQIDGAEDRLFPGYARFEASLDKRVMTERRSLRSALERQKMRALENFVQEGRTRLNQTIAHAPVGGMETGSNVALVATQLDQEQLAAVKLALKTKRLPLTPDDFERQRDESLSLAERFSTGFSGIPLAEYYQAYFVRCGFSAEVLRLVEFLVAHRRAFKNFTEAGMNDDASVAQFAQLCGDESRLCCLYVFTCADRSEWEDERTHAARWYIIRELFGKARRIFRPGPDPVQALMRRGFSSEQVETLREFGDALFGGRYGEYAERFGAQLLRLAENPEETGPRVILVCDGSSMIVGVAARDYRGLAASISGALRSLQIELSQAHLFSAKMLGLALDFFHVLPRGGALPPDLVRVLTASIQQRLHIGDADETDMTRIPERPTLQEWRPGQFCLRLETSHDSGGLVYALTYKVFRYLKGDIFGLAARAEQGRAVVLVYLTLPEGMSLEEAQSIVARYF